MTCKCGNSLTLAVTVAVIALFLVSWTRKPSSGQGVVTASETRRFIARKNQNGNQITDRSSINDVRGRGFGSNAIKARRFRQDRENEELQEKIVIDEISYQSPKQEAQKYDHPRGTHVWHHRGSATSRESFRKAVVKASTHIPDKHDISWYTKMAAIIGGLITRSSTMDSDPSFNLARRLSYRYSDFLSDFLSK